MRLIRQWLGAPVAYHTLYRDFVVQDLGGRYAGSMGGLAWTVLVPLAQLAVYVFVFSTIMRVDVDRSAVGTDRFVIYLLTGMIPWLAFAESLTRAPSLLVERASLITKVAFPVEILPLVGSSVPFLLNGVGFGILLVYLAFYGYADVVWLSLPLVVVMQFLFTVGVVAIVSALGVFVRDIQQFIGIVVFTWFFLTPIVYPLSMVPEAFRGWLRLNPMFPFIDLYRSILLRNAVAPGSCVATSLLAVTVFLAGGWLFLRFKPAFADVL